MVKRVRSSRVFTVVGIGALVAASAVAANWIPVGPGSGYSFGISSVVVHPLSPNAIWAGLPQGGLYRSLDRGANWVWAGRPFVSPWGGPSGDSTFAQDTSAAGALWGASVAGFFHSPNGGVTWTLVAGPNFTDLLAGARPRRLVAGDRWLYVVMERRLLASPDAGRTWAIAYDGPGAIQGFASSPKNPAGLFLAVYSSDHGGELLKSTEAGGGSWGVVPLARPVPNEGVNTMLGTDLGVYVALTGAAPELLRSTDAGVSWQPLRGDSGASFDVRSLVADARTPRVLYLSGTLLDSERPEAALWVSRNAGRTWSRLAALPPGDLLVDRSGIFYAFTSDGLSVSLDAGSNWKTILRAPSSFSSNAQLHFWPTSTASMALTIGWSTYRSANGGRSWRLVNTPREVRDVLVVPSEPNHLIAVNATEAFVSGDGGRKWRRTVAHLRGIEALTPLDERTLLAAGAGVYRSADAGETWATTLPGRAPGSSVSRWAQKIEADHADAGLVYALTFLLTRLDARHGPLAGLPSVLWRSRDGGLTWRSRNPNYRTFAVGLEPSRIYAVRDLDLLQSDDAGSSWKRIAITPELFHELILDPEHPGTFYAVGLGVWRSRDVGAHWEKLDAWNPNTLQLGPQGAGILYGAYNDGVFKLAIER